MTNEFEKLENALVRAGHALEYPATPPLASRVRSQIERAESTGNAVASEQAAGQPRPWLRVLMPLAAALLLALALLFALPDARDAVAQFLGLRGLRIFYGTPTPTALPTSTPRPGVTPSATALATPTVKPFTLCCETTLANAQKRTRFKLLVPSGETPSKVYYQNVYDSGEQVVLIFGDPDNPRFILYQAQRWIYGKMVGETYGKGIGPQTLIGEASVNGVRAVWFSGAPHVVMMLDAKGQPRYETARTVDANTLVWETGNEYDGVIYRLETKASLADAVRIAESLQEVKP